MSEHRTFDPSRYIRKLRGRGGESDYLDVKWRLVWLRTEHPDAHTGVEHIEITPEIAIFRATVSIPNGGSAMDYGSETPRDFGDYIEKAATKALGRALAQLGYGTQFTGDDLYEADRIVDAPVWRKSAPSQAAREDSTSSPAPTPARPTRTSPPSPPAALAGTAGPHPQPDEDATFDWTAFWSYARKLGISDRDELDAAAGQPTKGLQPAAIRRLIEQREIAV